MARLAAPRRAMALGAVLAAAACVQDTTEATPETTGGPRVGSSEEPFTQSELNELRLRIETWDSSAPVVEGGLTLGEVELLARQVEVCWRVPVGAAEPSEFAVELKLWMNPDGTVRRLEVVDKAKMTTSPYFRALAESAVKAVMRCMPLKLPRDKYDQWKVFVLYFDLGPFVQR